MNLADLYRDVIVDHNRHPRNRGRLECPTHHAEGDNPLCGDRLRLDIELDGDVIRDLRFEGSGCAISTASASLMGEAVKGRTRTEAAALFDAVHRMLTGAGGDAARLGKLAALAGVAEFPARVKCASLPWHTLNAALAGDQKPVTTE
jgi:nitrogen fixation NifU-like protein